MNESWSEKNNRLDQESQSARDQETNNPGLRVKLQKKIVTDDIFGIMFITRKLKSMKNIFKKSQILALLLPCIMFANCAGIHAVGPDGSKFTAMNLGGKQMMSGVRSPAVSIDSYYTDTEAAFKHIASMAAIMYSVNQVTGAFKAFQGEKTARAAQDALTTQKAAEAAAASEALKVKAGLIKDVGVVGEVPIGPINLP